MKNSVNYTKFTLLKIGLIEVGSRNDFKRSLMHALSLKACSRCLKSFIGLSPILTEKLVDNWCPECANYMRIQYNEEPEPSCRSEFEVRFQALHPA